LQKKNAGILLLSTTIAKQADQGKPQSFTFPLQLSILPQTELATSLAVIAQVAVEKERENQDFRFFLQQQDSDAVDRVVHRLNDEISARIDCTQCGNCCRSLMINITPDETTVLAQKLEKPLQELKATYIEESMEGEYILKQMPCPFLGGNSCTIYADRFTECRDFPHLHKPNFTGRLFGMLMNYAICPIVFNVMEALKKETGFR
jgi:uncharacterized protein